MAILMRGGLKKDFDPQKMRAKEWAVSTDAETEKQIVWMCFRPGVVKRMGTYEDFKEQIREATDDIREEYGKTFEEIKVYMEGLKTDTEGYKNVASQKAAQASNFATQASTSASNAAESASSSANSANNSEDFSELSKSWARGETGTRQDENTNNSKFFSDLASVLVAEAQKLLEQAQKIVSAATAGALIPVGTVAFEDIPLTPNVGYMYNISNDFVTDSRFAEGSGVFYRAGANIYWTADGQWDVMIGMQVTGVKGNSESTYRVGNVNLTAANVGALSTSGGSVIGNINIKKETGGAFLTARRTDTECQIDFGVASDGTTRGIYDEKKSKWIVKITDNGSFFDGAAVNMKPIVLSNQNLDDLRPNSAVFYYAPGGNTVQNNPFGNGIGFGMYVYHSGGTYLIQEAASYNGKKIRCWTGGGGWTPWKTFAFDDAFYAATASAAGKSGLVPAPAAGKQNAYLRGDGTWVEPGTTLAGTVTGIPLDQTMGKQLKDEIDTLNGNLQNKANLNSENTFANTVTSTNNKDLNIGCYITGQFSSWAQFHVNPNARAGYGFHNQGSNGIFLYLDIDGTLKYMDVAGVIHQIQAVRIN